MLGEQLRQLVVHLLAALGIVGADRAAGTLLQVIAQHELRDRPQRLMDGRDLHEDEGRDFVSEVHLRLIEGDYSIIRKFEGRASFTTYVTTVIHRLFYQYRVERWGKWRPSAEARRLGDKAITLERLITRDGYSFEEACEILTTPGDGVYKRRDLEAIWYRLPPRHPRPVLVSEVVSTEVGVEPEAPDRAEWGERERTARAAIAIIDRLILAAHPDDQAILRMRYWNGRKVPDIARALNLDQKKVYKRIEKLQTVMRRALEEAGLGQAIIDDVLQRGDHELHITVGKSEVSPSNDADEGTGGGSRRLR